MNDRINPTQALLALLDARQNKRLLLLHFPNGDSPTSALLLADSMVATEALGVDFCCEVKLLSDKPNVAQKDMLGKRVTLELRRTAGGSRYFNGYVAEFRFDRNEGGFARYEMVVVPKMNFMRLRHNSRLWHGKTFYQQIDELFREHAMNDWRISRFRTDEPMTDACQYEESDYNYVYRRLEDLGAFTFYEHTAEQHFLTICGDSMACEPIEGASPEIAWQGRSGLRKTGLQSLSPIRSIAATNYAATSFDFKDPRPLTVEVPTLNQQGDVPRLEMHEFAGAYGFKDQADGDAYIRRRMEAIEAHAKRFDAESDDDRVQAGRWFRASGLIEDFIDQSKRIAAQGDNEFLITSCTHFVRNNFEATDSGASEYSNRFGCLRRKIPWRPAPGFNSNEPRIYGLQTAIVVGPKGQEIHTDNYGRVRVQFHWDRLGTFDEKSSAWIRVATPWSGKGYGMLGIPRIGQEVIVQFLDGNPDRPIVMSCVYNRHNLPAWDLPAAAHQLGFRSRSTPGGGGHCEMVIHDSKGQELINIHSQRDMVTTVLNNHSTVVKGPQQSVEVTDGAQSTTVKQSISIESLDSEITLTSKTKMTFTCGASSIVMDSEGNILIQGRNVKVIGGDRVDVNP